MAEDALAALGQRRGNVAPSLADARADRAPGYLAKLDRNS